MDSAPLAGLAVRGQTLNNDDVYAQGLSLVRRLIPQGCRVVDFGCGTGRHLIGLRDHIALGVGFDYEQAYIAQANRSGAASRCHFFVADATAVPLTCAFDVAVCLTNTWGTMRHKIAVLDEMKRLSPTPGSRLLTVYAATSVRVRGPFADPAARPVQI